MNGVIPAQRSELCLTVTVRHGERLLCGPTSVPVMESCHTAVAALLPCLAMRQSAPWGCPTPSPQKHTSQCGCCHGWTHSPALPVRLSHMFVVGHVGPMSIGRRQQLQH